jgi:hypothetical protein
LFFVLFCRFGPVHIKALTVMATYLADVLQRMVDDHPANRLGSKLINY